MHHCATHNCKKPTVCKCRFMRQTTIPVIWILGGVGSGKKTLGNSLAKRFDMTFISGGELLRDISMSNSKKAPEILKKLLEGDLIDDELMVELLENRMKVLFKATQGFVLSFVKNLHQAELFERFVAPVDLVMFLDCSETVMLQRGNERLASSPETVDSPEKIEARVEQFKSTIQDLLAKYKRAKRISAEIDPDQMLTLATEYVSKAKAVKTGDDVASYASDNEEATPMDAGPNPDPNPKGIE